MNVRSIGFTEGESTFLVEQNGRRGKIAAVAPSLSEGILTFNGLAFLSLEFF